LEPGLFYLFYGDGGFPDRLLHRLLVEAVKRGRGAVYLVCGNYRRSRTVMDSDLLLSLIDETGLDVGGALSRIHVICAFSEKHLIRAPDLLKELLEGAGEFSLVAVQQIAKLFYGKHAVRREDPSEFIGVVSKLRTVCSERGVVLAATGRASGCRRPVPGPEGGSFLRHAASAIVYLREPPGGFLSAYLLKHPDRAHTGKLVHFGGGRGPIWAE